MARGLAAPLRLFVLCLSCRRVCSQAGGPIPGILTSEESAQLAPDRLFQVVAMELEAEDGRPTEPLLRFDEFQDTIDLNCHERLVYFINQTITLRDRLHAYQNDVAGVSGLYWQLLQKAPAENSWIWVMTSAHERILNQIHSYMAKLSFLALDRPKCLMTQIRVVLLDAVVTWKRLHGDFTALLWDGFAFGTYGNSTLSADLDRHLRDATWPESLMAANIWIGSTRDWFDQHTQDLFDATVKEAPQTHQIENEAEATRLHHQDEIGMFVPFEYLRRKVFGQWALDKGLLRGLLRHVWQPSYEEGETMSLGDFGAGGGQYCTWLNETGLVEAFAFDGTAKASLVTDGVVQEINLVEEQKLWRTFDWVMSLEVGEHVPAQYSAALLQNLRRHLRSGLVMSWSSDWEGIGHVNCLSEAEFIATVERETGLRVDWSATNEVRASCEIDYIARGVAIFRVPT